MRPGPRKLQLIALNAVQQQLIRLDMKVVKAFQSPLNGWPLSPSGTGLPSISSDYIALILPMSFPRFCARFTSRLNRPDQTGVSTSDAQTLEQRGRRGGTTPLALAQVLHRAAARRVRHSTANGRRCSSAMRSISRRIASDIDRPIAPSAADARSLVSRSIRARTMASAVMRGAHICSSNVATNETQCKAALSLPRP